MFGLLHCSALRRPGHFQMRSQNDTSGGSWTRVRTTGRVVYQRGQMQDKPAATFTTKLSGGVRNVFAVLAVDCLVDWDTDKAVRRAKHLDLTHEIPPDERGTTMQPAGR